MAAPDPVRRVLPLVAALAAAAVVAQAILGTTIVRGPSMEPGLRSGDRVLVDRWTYRHRPPRPGEVVLVRDPAGRTLVKRVDRSEGGQVWVVGDNPDRSRDSRRFGPLAGAAVAGRVVARVWPPGRVGTVE